jgi:hypothetical protein
MAEQTKLEKLMIEEISGVDDPANQSPGFMVFKAAKTKRLTETAESPLRQYADDLFVRAAMRNAPLTVIKAILFRPREVEGLNEELVTKAAETFGLATPLVIDGSVEVRKGWRPGDALPMRTQ